MRPGPPRACGGRSNRSSKGQIERFLKDMDVAEREEVEVLRDMVVAGREENEQLALRLTALEARVAALEGAPAAEPHPAAPGPDAAGGQPH